MRRKAMILLLAGLALVTSACGSDNKVGDQSLLDFKEQAQSRLGETTTTTAAATTTTIAKGSISTTTKPPAGKPGAATPTTAKAGSPAPAPTATTARPTQAVREIYLYADNDPGHDALEPQIQTAFLGSVIRWINKDTVPRAVRADSGQFASPSIPPGGSWDYTAGTAGAFDYSDDTRPYVTGKLVVSKP